MRATFTGRIPLPTGGFLENPFVEHNGEKKDTRNGTYIINFDLCVNQDVEQRVVDGEGQPTGETTTVNKKIVIWTFPHSFDASERDAIITTPEGEDVPLIGYLAAGGELVEDNVKDWGKPMYSELDQYFETSFADVIFKPTPAGYPVDTEALGKLWALNTIRYFGKTMREWGFEWE